MWHAKKEKAAIIWLTQILTLTLLLVVEASENSLLVDQSQMEYDRIPEKLLSPPRISFRAKIKKDM